MTNTAKTLNSVLADAHVLYTKIHNFHWNIKGPQFIEIHEKTESYYNHFGELYDQTAERILQLGDKPLVTLKQILEHSGIKETEKNNFNAKEVFESLLFDFNYMKNKILEIEPLFETDISTTNLLQGEIEFLEKEIWMLESSI